MLESASPAPALKGTLTCVGGVAEGPLLGGNLSRSDFLATLKKALDPNQVLSPGRYIPAPELRR